MLKLISQRLDISLALALKVSVVALKGIHLPSEPRLVLLVKHTALLVVCSQTTLHCIVLKLTLMQVLLELVELAAHTIYLQVLLL
ncbi:MAG: hypothetical protein ACK56I_12075 [bacterium]